MPEKPNGYPPELDHQPRMVRWRDADALLPVFLFGCMAVGFGVLAVAVIAPIVAWAIWRANQQASVTECRVNSNGRNGSYSLIYTYPAGGQTRQGSEAVSLSDFNEMHAALLFAEKGQRPLVDVRVLALGPWSMVHMLRSQESPWHAAMRNQLTTIGIGLVFMGLCMGFIGFGSPLQERCLYQKGLPAPGVITRKDTVGGKARSYRLYYTFASANGDTHQKDMTVLKSHWKKAAEGEEVTVLYSEGGEGFLHL